MADGRTVTVTVQPVYDEDAVRALQELYRGLTATMHDLSTAVNVAEQRIGVALSVYANEIHRSRTPSQESS